MTIPLPVYPSAIISDIRKIALRLPLELGVDTPEAVPVVVELLVPAAVPGL